MIEIPFRIKLVISGVVVVSTAAAFFMHGEIRYKAGQQFEKDAQAVAVAKANTVERVKEQVVTTDKDKSYDQYIEQRDKALAAAAAARTELDRLRVTLAGYNRRASESTTTQCGADETAPLVEVVERCSTRHQEVARDAQLDAEQVIGLQNYIKAIAPICIGETVQVTKGNEP